LTQAAQIEVSDRTSTKSEAWERIDRARDKYAGQTFSDSAELCRESTAGFIYCDTEV
jgi:hypothetical protein